MRGCLFAVVLAMVFGTSARAEFVLQFDPQAKILANAPNQVVDLYLTSTTTVDIWGLKLRAYLGDERSDVTPESGTYPPGHLGTKGNFEKGGLSPYGVQIAGEGYFWPDGTRVRPPSNWTDDAQNVTRVEIGPPAPTLLEADHTVKVATLHIDTTGFSGPQLNIGLGHDDYFNGPSDFITLVEAGAPSDRSTSRFTIDNGLTVQGGAYQISSTPEPSIIGLAGLGLAAGAGWLRTRRRRGKAAP